MCKSGFVLKTDSRLRIKEIRGIVSAVNNAFGVHSDNGQVIVAMLVVLAQIAGIVVLQFNTALKTVGPRSSIRSLPQSSVL